MDVGRELDIVLFMFPPAIRLALRITLKVALGRVGKSTRANDNDTTALILVDALERGNFEVEQGPPGGDANSEGNGKS